MDATSLKVFQRVLSAIPTNKSQVLKSDNLKILYHFFIQLLEISRNWSNCRAANHEGIKIHNLNYTVKFSDILSIATFIFAELSRKFKPCLSNKKLAQSSLGLVDSRDARDSILLLRCCLGVLPLLEVEPTVFIGKCRELLMLLRKICSPELSLDDSDSPTPFLSSILEVFTDELLAHKQLRKYLILVDDVSFTNEKLFKHHLHDGDNQIDVLLAMICAHFILSNHYVDAGKQFLGTSILGKEAPSLELCLASSVQLLAITLLVSAPYIFQAHLISIVSKCISIVRDSEAPKEKALLITQYTTAFEISFILYARHISYLKECGSVPYDNPAISKGVDCPTLESLIQPSTYKRVIQASNLCDYGRSVLFKTKSGFLSASDTYIKEKEQILDTSCKDEIMIVLNSIVSQSLGKVEGIGSHIERDASKEEIHLLASIVNLMSNSLLQINQFMRDGSLKDQSFSKEYGFVINTISCLLSSVDGHSTERVLEETVGSSPASCKETKQMIIHFAGFLPFCYSNNHEYLWRGCILMMMALTNLIIFEDGNLDAMKAFLDSTIKPSKDSGRLDVRKSSLRIASKIEKARRKSSVNTDKMWSGESKEKDYEKYVKDREKYRTEKFVREKSSKRKRKKKSIIGKFHEMKSLFS
ncbi:hypothetical protein ACHQM5_030406 [Ranunculus cassubicifolius]